ncbi:TPA: alpha/beta hydrolase [Pseudomonas putida]|nr:alpha/beta hydrolase [Pseudomonas putida]
MINKTAISLLLASVAMNISAAEHNIVCKSPLPVPAPQEEWSLFQDTVKRAPAVMGDVHREFYGEGLDNFGDLRLPQGEGPFPVVIVVHGGRWSADVGLDYMAPVADMLTKAGFATWNIEYSRVGSYGEWPNSFKSVAGAADHLRELAKKYPLDLRRTVTLGHSSGGHYALWLAGRNLLKADSELYVKNPLSISGVLVLDGVVDLAWHAQLPRGKDIQPKVLGHVQGKELQARLQEVSPTQMPIIKVPQVFITNQSDRFPSVLDYVKRATAAGANSKYDALCSSNHFVPVDTSNDEVTKKIIEYTTELAQ